MIRKIKIGALIIAGSMFVQLAGCTKEVTTTTTTTTVTRPATTSTKTSTITTNTSFDSTGTNSAMNQ